jgi:hypothetical protein
MKSIAIFLFLVSAASAQTFTPFHGNHVGATPVFKGQIPDGCRVLAVQLVLKNSASIWVKGLPVGWSSMVEHSGDEMVLIMIGGGFDAAQTEIKALLQSVAIGPALDGDDKEEILQVVSGYLILVEKAKRPWVVALDPVDIQISQTGHDSFFPGVAPVGPLFWDAEKPPNKSPEATTLARTPAADAPVAPAVGRASS